MILFSILLSAGLDMSLPEFEPDMDLSGNYIVSGYDVSSGESVVEVIPAAELLESVDLRTEATAETQDIVDAIQTMNDDNNSYWELFLDSYPVEVNHSLRSTYVTALSWKFTANGGFTTAGGSNDHYSYIPVVAGLEYDLSNITQPSYNSYRYGVVNDLNNPNVVTNFGSGNISELNFVAGQTGYFVFYVNYNKEIGFLANWITIEQESYTLSELGNAVMEIRSNNDMKFRILIFLTLINFVYPIVISSFKNFFGGGKNV